MILIDLVARRPQRTTSGSDSPPSIAPRDAVYKMLRNATSFARFVEDVDDLREIDPIHYLSSNLCPRVGHPEVRDAVRLARASAGP
jgi:hypothetical protein